MSANPLSLLVGPLYGSIYLGTIMSTAIYGVTCMQTFFYYVHYEDDPVLIKILVAVLWALNTIHEALCISGVYKYIIAGLVNPLTFMIAIPDLILIYPLTALVAVPTQGFLVYRIYVVSRKSIAVPLIWAPLALVQLGFLLISVTATTYAGKALYSVNGVVHAVDVEVINSGIIATLTTISLSVAAGVDVLIAIFMTFLLFRERAATAIASTAHLMQRLIVFAVNTGTWSATFALLTIILLHLFPTDLYYGIVLFPLCPVYCNTLLANLNARVYFRDGAFHNVDADLFTSPSLQASDNVYGDHHPGLGEVLPRNSVPPPSNDPMAIGSQVAVTFPDANQSVKVSVKAPQAADI